MQKYHNILDKLNQFTKRFYAKMLIKGILLFLVFGALFFFVAMGVEYLLWLNSTGRFILLLAFVGVETYLLIKYILTPLFFLFKIKKGISDKQASQLIGKHFPEVGDKLYNLLDLAEDKNTSELLLASIEQRSENLVLVPFSRAIDFGENLKYAKYLAIPVLIFGLIWLSGNLNTFINSYKRVVHYDLAYEPPAPFAFKLISTNLNVLENEAFTVQATTFGQVRPKDVFITMDGTDFLLQERNNIFQHTFSPPLKDTDFYFTANGIKSRRYRLNVLKAPSIQNFKIVLDYPDYTGKLSETLKSTGNATVLEGTKVIWKIEGRHTDHIDLIAQDTSFAFVEGDGIFGFSKRIYEHFPYQIATSNENIKNYEKLDYRFNVIKDAYPTIRVEQVLDSLNPNVSFYLGEASDDYRLTKIKLVCYPDEDSNNKQSIELNKPNTNFSQFYYTFPSGLKLEEGKRYSFYFEAVDNDAIHNGKSVKSQVFTIAMFDQEQLRSKELESQEAIIDNMDRSLEKFKEQKEALNEINALQKEKGQLSFNDQNQIKDFLRKQQQQENLMQKFSKQLKENLNKNKNDDTLNKLLKERLERQELEAKKNERLLEELNKIADKIDKEELAKRLEDIAKQQQNSERNLEQLLELVKRYYVTEKAAQLAKDLEIFSKKQRQAAENEEDKIQEQDDLNKVFEEIAKEMNELKKDNEDLKKPLSLEIDEEKAAAIKSDQKEASDELKKEKSEQSDEERKQEAGEKASKKQKTAAQKMKEMSEALSQSASSSGSGSTITEDAEMLRQILDNLLTFSFKQEKLFEVLETSNVGISEFSGTIREQQELRDLFEHVDDSLFALSLRRAELSEFVNKQITEVYYNIDKSLESIAENQIYQSVSHQKYVLSASNGLADFLARILDNMQLSMMSGSGSGEGQGFQLPDIIKGQGELKEKMKGKGKSGKGQPNDGEGKNGKGINEGQGKDGKKGREGNEGGNSGQEGQGNAQGVGQPSEKELQEIYEIYKSQQILREHLEQQLQDMIDASDRKLGEKIIRQMEDFEDDLLENGVTQRSLNKINAIQYELLKLENAALKQGKKQERESNSSENQFHNPITTKPSVLENYRNENEILNRHALPLRQIFKNKVKHYFKSDD